MVHSPGRVAYQRLPAPEWRRLLLDRLRDSPGAVVVSGLDVAGNDDLLALASTLGQVTTSGTRIPGHPLEDGRVYRVEPVNSGDGVTDEAGWLIYSTTEQDFDGHTDGYHNEVPPEFVLLLCVRADPEPFGRSTLADGWLAVARLAPTTRALLRDPAYPAVFGPTRILSGPEGDPLLRFNMREIMRFSAAAPGALDAAHQQAARDLARSLADPGTRWEGRLEPGECLVLDNRRAVHGRSRLAPSSRRLLKRTWVEARQPTTAPGGVRT